MVRRRGIRLMALAVSACLLAGTTSSGEERKTPNLRPSRQAATQPRALPPGEPAIVMWDGGIHMLGIEPFLTFAAWADGTVLQRTGGRDGRLRIGRADPKEIAKLLENCEAAGFFDPPIRSNSCTDGPELRICLRRGRQRQVLAYHGRDEWNRLDEIGPRAGPSRYAVARFVRLWRQAEAGINALRPADMKDYTGPVSLEYPWFAAEMARRRTATSPARGASGSVDDLIAGLKDPDPKVRCAAAAELNDLPDPRAIEPLLAVLNDPFLDDAVMHLASGALWRIDLRAIPRLVQGLKDKDRVIRRRSAEVLGLIISYQAIDPLINALGDPDAAVRREAARGLGERQDKRAVRAVTALLEDPDAQVRAAAAAALEPLCSPEQPGRKLRVEGLLKDPDAEVRAAADAAMERLSAAKARQALLARLQGDPEAEVRAAAALALGWCVDEHVKQALTDRLRSDADGGVRSAAACILAEQADVAELMLEALKDKDASVRSQAAEYLVSRGDARAIQPLIAALKDRSLDVRMAAARGLGKFGDAKAAEALEALIPAGEEERTFLHRLAAEAAKAIRSRIGQVEAPAE